MKNFQFSIFNFQSISNFKFQISNSLRSRAGFTLLELLVVIAIMVILIAMGTSSFATAQKKGRDAKRKSDLKEVQTALEQYYSVCNYNYPIPTDFYSQGIVCTTPSLAVMPTVPYDPRSTPYFCPTPVATNCTTSTYTICTRLESEPTPEYCLRNQQ
jgi:prepilin-type N-terminal cleavage/methylation domain-containing protein